MNWTDSFGKYCNYNNIIFSLYRNELCFLFCVIFVLSSVSVNFDSTSSSPPCLFQLTFISFPHNCKLDYFLYFIFHCLLVLWMRQSSVDSVCMSLLNELFYSFYEFCWILSEILDRLQDVRGLCGSHTNLVPAPIWNYN